MTDRQKRVTLAECPPGLFAFRGTIGFKTEYGAMETVGPADVPGDQLRWTVGRSPDAYCVESGEYFWGGTKRREDRAKLMVEPIEWPKLPDLSAVEAILATRAKAAALVRSHAARLGMDTFGAEQLAKAIEAITTEVME